MLGVNTLVLLLTVTVCVYNYNTSVGRTMVYACCFSYIPSCFFVPCPGGLVMRVTGNPTLSLNNYVDSDDEGLEVDGMLDNLDEEEDGDYEDEQGLRATQRPRHLQKDFIVSKYSIALRFYFKVSNM